MPRLITLATQSVLDRLRRHWPLPVIMLVAGRVFTCGVSTGAMQPFYVDEWFFDRYALELVQWIVLHQPVQFSYVHPSGYSLTLAGLYGLYYLYGSMAGQFANLTDFLVRFATQRVDFVVLGRLLSAGYALAALPALYWLALRMFDRRVAILSVLAVTFCYPIVFYAHLVANITMLVFLAAWAGCWVYQVWQRGSTLDYLLAGAFIGAGIGTKYYPALLFFPLGLAHFMRLGWNSRRPGHLLVEWYKMALAGVVAFLVAVTFFPLPVFAYDQWHPYLQDTLSYYTGGNPLENARQLIAGNPTYWAQTAAEPVSMWANSLRVVGEAGLIWLGFGLAYGLWRFPRKWLILATPFLLLFIYQCVRGGLGLGVRQFYFALGLLWILSAAAVMDLTARIRLARTRQGLSAVIVGSLLLLQPAWWTISYLRLASNPTTIDTAQAWLLANLPADATLLVDSGYAPFGVAASWRNWQDPGNSLAGDSEQAVRDARAAAAPAFQVVALAVEDADAELSEWQGYLKPVYVATTDYSSAYWLLETRAAFGNVNAGNSSRKLRYYEILRERTQVVRVFSPRELRALGPTVTIALLPP